MEKRTIIAVVLSLVVLYGYSWLVPGQKPASKPAAVAPAASQSAVPVAPVTSGVPAVAQQAATAKVQEIVVETDLYRATVSTVGGRVSALALKQYQTTPKAGAAPVNLVPAGQPELAALHLEARGIGLEPNALYAASNDNLKIGKGEQKTLVLTTTTAAGVTVRRSYTFSGDSYAIDLAYELSNGGNQPASAQLRHVMTLPTAKDKDAGQYDTVEFVSYRDGSLAKVQPDAVKEDGKSFDKQVLWSGTSNRYFLQALIGREGSLAAVQLRKLGGGQAEAQLVSPAASLAPGNTARFAYRFYGGPKVLELLKGQGDHLEAAVDLGWFTAIAKPLLTSLKFLYRYTGNYGLAIIIITLIIKILFFPLTHSSYRSMKEMQKLQPQMTALREKYKDDRDRMNKEIMQLYQEHRVNPLGGCLPMVVQIPVFIALYNALLYAIELRHAPFMLWLTDLSAKDPYLVTPVLMGASMFIQQKMTPSAMDPMQAKIMLALPVVFTFFFLGMPSGLVLYWLVNNILSIIQQWYINRTVHAAA